MEGGRKDNDGGRGGSCSARFQAGSGYFCTSFSYNTRDLPQQNLAVEFRLGFPLTYA